LTCCLLSIPKFVFAIYLLIWWGEKQMHNKEPMDIAFSVVLFIAIACLQVTQVYGSWVVWCIATKVKRDAIAQTMSMNDMEKSQNTMAEAVLGLPRFLNESSRSSSGATSTTYAEEESKRSEEDEIKRATAC
jgi:hypothetical protein